MRLIIEGLSAVPRNADPVLLKEIRRAHRCFEALVSGQVRSVAELATVEGISDRVSPTRPENTGTPGLREPDSNPHYGGRICTALRDRFAATLSE